MAGINDRPKLNYLDRKVAALATLLINESTDQHTGSLFHVHDKGLSKLRWERSDGITFNPDENFTADTLSQGWNTIYDFSNKSLPSGPMNFTELLPKSRALPRNVHNNTTRFDGKVVIVTGGASGYVLTDNWALIKIVTALGRLGRCYSLAFAQLGASVVVNDLNDASETVRDITSAGGKAISCIASCENGQEIVTAAIQAFGQIDILINNAGFLRDKSFANMDQNAWDAVLNVHLNGTYQMTKAVWPYFKKQRKGSIVNTTSTSGIYGVFGQANYSTAVSTQLKNLIHTANFYERN